MAIPYYHVTLCYILFELMHNILRDAYKCIHADAVFPFS